MKTQSEYHNLIRTYAVPDRILLATDLDDTEYLLPHAIAQALATGATLTLAHVTPPAESIPLDASAIYSADAAAILVEAKWTLDGMAAKAYASGLAASPIVCQGTPQRVIPELVKTIGADRLILGTHGRRHMKKMLLGSVALEILNSVEIPVCTIGPNAHTRPAPVTPKRILHPVSLHPGHEQSARLALEMAQFYQAEITLLHVIDRNFGNEYRSARAAEWTRTAVERLIPDEAPLWTYVHAQVEVGGVVDHILNVAAEMQADLIVLGIDPAEGYRHASGDGIAYEIITRAGCPVITARHGAEVSAEMSESKPAPGHAAGAFAGMF